MIWHLGLDNCADNEDFDFLRSRSKCIVDLLKDPTSGVPEARLEFSLVRNGDLGLFPSLAADVVSSSSSDDGWLGLQVWEMKYCGKVLCYNMVVGLLDENLEPLQGTVDWLCGLKGYQQRKSSSGVKLVDRFIQVNKMVPGVLHKQDIWIKISVRPVYFSEAILPPPQPEVENPSPSLATLVSDMKSMFLSQDENYADLKLEMEDGITLWGHRFVLAARSTFLRDLIESSSRQNDFNGTVKVEGIGSKAMLPIRHWMYCDEFPEFGSNNSNIEEIVNAAVKLELKDLLRILDGKMVTVCKPENMFQLYELAKRNRMLKAVEDVSKFIKE